MATTCDNCTQQAVRAVTDMETGAPSFFCLDHYGNAAAGVPAAPLPETCEQCESEPMSMVLTQPQSGLKLHLGHRCYLVNGRAAWLSADADEYETLDQMAEQMLGLAPGVAKRAKGRRRKVAVDSNGDAPPPVDAQPEKEPEAVGAAAGASDATATDAND